MTNGAFLLGFGRLCDLYGRKTILVGSLVMLTIFCVGSGFSDDGITLDILNGVLGLTSAAAVPAALGILGAAYEGPSRRKNYAFACFSAGNPLGFVFGCIIGGIATQVASWRATYWVLAVIFLITTIIALFATPVDTSTKSELNGEMLKKFDVVGILLTAGGIAMFSAALTEGSEASKGWKTPYVIVLLVLGVVCMVGFVLWELRYRYPLVPMSIWRDRNFSLLVAILVLGFLSFPVALFWAALFFQRVWNFSPLETAVHLLPAAISGIAINVVAGLFLHRISNKLLTGIGAVAYTVACILMALNKEDSSYWAFYFPALALIVVGADFHFNVCNMYIMSSRPREEQSLSGGIIQTVTKLCQTLGFGIATALFDSIQANPTSMSFHMGDPSQPYSAVFWYCTAAPALSIFLVPFLTIGTQGNAGVEGPDMTAQEPARNIKEEKALRL